MPRYRISYIVYQSHNEEVLKYPFVDNRSNYLPARRIIIYGVNQPVYETVNVFLTACTKRNPDMRYRERYCSRMHKGRLVYKDRHLLSDGYQNIIDDVRSDNRLEE